MAAKNNRSTGGYILNKPKKNEMAVERYGRMVERTASDALRRRNAGESGYAKITEEEVKAQGKISRENYRKNLSTSEGRKLNKANEKFVREVDLPKANSIEQYQAEKQAGDPYARSMSFEAWKRLD